MVSRKLDMFVSFPSIYRRLKHTNCAVHLNLRDQFLPYKHLIAEILLDKNKNIRTVIRKTEEVGSHSEFRTFPYELLAG